MGAGSTLLVFAVPVLLTLGLLSLASGVLLGLAGRWGVVRQVDPGLTERPGRIPLDLLFPALVSGTALLVASVLAIWKPWTDPWPVTDDAEKRTAAPTPRTETLFCLNQTCTRRDSNP